MSLVETDYCVLCDDSGYIESYKGGVWTGQRIVTHQTICSCAVGDDVRRELSIIAARKLTDYIPPPQLPSGS